MATTSAPINKLWFLNSFVAIRVSNSEGKDGISVLDHRVPHGDSPPMHLHRTEDEVFHVLEGEFRVSLDGKESQARTGDIFLAPKGIPHTYRAESLQGGRFLTITVKGDFERFVRILGRPAERAELPPPAGPPSPETIQALAATAADYGIQIVGPPLQ
jgi:quercetin dioxygenase-like cupin family protein